MMKDEKIHFTRARITIDGIKIVDHLNDYIRLRAKLCEENWEYYELPHMVLRIQISAEW